jgi:hypothetical protein
MEEDSLDSESNLTVTSDIINMYNDVTESHEMKFHKSKTSNKFFGHSILSSGNELRNRPDISSDLSAEMSKSM